MARDSFVICEYCAAVIVLRDKEGMLFSKESELLDDVFTKRVVSRE